MYVYEWVTLLQSRNWHNIMNQLYFKKNKHTRILTVFCNLPYLTSAQGQSLDLPPFFSPHPSSPGLIHHKFQTTVKVLKTV